MSWLKRYNDSDKTKYSWISYPRIKNLVIEIDKKIRDLVTVTPQTIHIRSATGDFMEIVKNIELISSLCPGNPDVEFTYICALYAALQGREATKELQLFMKKYPEYLEAKRMNEHYEDWPHPPGIFHLPSWSDQETKIPEIVKNRQGSSGWHSVRDGIFRIVSAFIPCSKSDLRDTPILKTRCKINAEFTHTPYGPVVGLYTLLEDDPSTPFYHEQLMNPVYDTLFKPTGFVYRIF